jgi:hypothetical protein
MLHLSYQTKQRIATPRISGIGLEVSRAAPGPAIRPTHPEAIVGNSRDGQKRTFVTATCEW